MSYIDKLQEYGFNCLTGESCAFGLRLLFDVTEKGKIILENFLGNTVSMNAGSSWNSQENFSVMLSPETAKELLLFCYLTDGQYEEVWYMEDSFSGMSYVPMDIERLKQYEKNEDKGFFHIGRKFKCSKIDRNRHQMSGRII